jgi:hypothetical protein
MPHKSPDTPYLNLHTHYPHRHPAGQPTVPRADWRGSTSDPLIGAVSLGNMARTLRFRIHMLSSLYPDVLDARITKARAYVFLSVCLWLCVCVCVCLLHCRNVASYCGYINVG